MMKKMVGTLGVPVLALGLMIAPGCGDGGGHDPLPDADADDDADDALDDVPVDVPADGDDAADVPADVEMDGEDVIEDVEDEEGVSHATGTPFSVETSGGARLSNSSFVLDLFIGPARPIGDLSGGSYELQLGPAGLRSH